MLITPQLIRSLFQRKWRFNLKLGSYWLLSLSCPSIFVLESNLYFSVSLTITQRVAYRSKSFSLSLFWMFWYQETHAWRVEYLIFCRENFHRRQLGHISRYINHNQTVTENDPWRRNLLDRLICLTFHL